MTSLTAAVFRVEVAVLVGLHVAGVVDAKRDAHDGRVAAGVDVLRSSGLRGCAVSWKVLGGHAWKRGSGHRLHTRGPFYTLAPSCEAVDLRKELLDLLVEVFHFFFQRCDFIALRDEACDDSCKNHQESDGDLDGICFCKLHVGMSLLIAL